MRYTALRLAGVAAVWFAIAVGICFPLVISLTPGVAVFGAERLLLSVLSGVSTYAVPAAVVGALLARRLAVGGAVSVFLLGALAVLAMCLLAGPWLALWSQGAWFFTRCAADAVDAAALQLFVTFTGASGMALVLGGLAAVAFRAAVSTWRRA